MLTAHRLEFTLEALTPITLNEHQGSALRGALYNALRGQEHGPWGGFCAQKRLSSCAECMLAAACPVCLLVSTLDPAAERGRDRPRPFVIDPPLRGPMRLEPGERLTCGLTLFSRALQLFPYVVLALRARGEGGRGNPSGGAGWGRGKARLVEAVATNPLIGARQVVLVAGEATVRVPDIGITHEQVLEAVQRLPAGRLALEFLTPTRLIEQGKLCKAPVFGTVFHRLWWRVAELAQAFGDEQEPEPEGLLDQEVKFRLVGLARAVRLAEDGTKWVELESYSTRRRRATPISGLVGRATFEGDLAPMLPWLVWGQFTHVGKDAVKGDGWYVIREHPGD